MWTSSKVPSHESLAHQHNLKNKYLFKVLVVGNAGCGKSSLVTRLASDQFQHSDTRTPTLGADFVRKTIDIAGKSTAKLQIWDLAGQDRHVKLIRPYFDGAKGAVILCDITNPASIESVMSWHEELASVFPGPNMACAIPVVIFINKIDLADQEEISSSKPKLSSVFEIASQLQSLCEERHVQGWFVGSAKTGLNVCNAFDLLCRSMVSHSLNTTVDVSGEDGVVLVRVGEYSGDVLSRCCWSM